MQNFIDHLKYSSPPSRPGPPSSAQLSSNVGPSCRMRWEAPTSADVPLARDRPPKCSRRTVRRCTLTRRDMVVMWCRVHDSPQDTQDKVFDNIWAKRLSHAHFSLTTIDHRGQASTHFYFYHHPCSCSMEVWKGSDQALAW